MIIPYISPSRISVYLTCPQMYKLKYHDKVPEMETPYRDLWDIGTLAHSVLEQFFKVHTIEMEECIDIVGPSIFKEFVFDESKKILLKWKNKMNRKHTFKTELQIGSHFDPFMIDGIPFFLKPDLLLLDSGILTIVDHKTGNYIPDDDELYNSPQTLFYPYAVENFFPKRKFDFIQFRYNYVRHNFLTRPIVYGNDERKYIKGYAKAIFDEISNDKIGKAAPELGGCKFCLLSYKCEVFNNMLKDDENLCFESDESTMETLALIESKVSILETVAKELKKQLMESMKNSNSTVKFIDNKKIVLMSRNITNYSSAFSKMDDTDLQILQALGGIKIVADKIEKCPKKLKKKIKDSAVTSKGTSYIRIFKGKKQ